MSGKKNMKSKQNMSESTEPQVAAKTLVAAKAPVEAKSLQDEAHVEAKAPVVTKQKGGRAKKAVTELKVEAVSQSVDVVASASASASASESKTVTEKKQRGGRKKPEVAQASVETVAAVVGGGKPKVSRASKAKSVTESVESKPTDVSKPTNVSKPKVSRKKKSDVVAAPETSADVLETKDGDKHIRSFKVKLPGSDSFEGRFTGLTPYQAANKALSKYFREGDRTDMDVTFSICESTRKSKKSVYTYVGKRHQLDVPVKYTIQDGREIVKNFKNTLKKVKKSDNTAQLSDVSVTMTASA